MSIAHGIIEGLKVSKPFTTNNTHTGQTETKVHISIHLNQVRYDYKWQEATIAPPFKIGDTVEFLWETNTSADGKYTNNVIDKKTFKVVNSVPHTAIQHVAQPAQQQTAPQQNNAPLNCTVLDARIAFQNAMAHATNICIHNAQAGGKVDYKEMMKLAHHIAWHTVNITPSNLQLPVAQSVPPATYTHAPAIQNGAAAAPMSVPIQQVPIDTSVPVPAPMVPIHQAASVEDYYSEQDLPNFNG